MSNDSIRFNAYVVKSILANNQFGITEVKGIESLKSIYFLREEYPKIEKLIKEKNIEVIKLLPENQSQAGEYLDIMMFKDQDSKKYIVTVYDSIELSQDPQIIEIYSFSTEQTL